jgi:hypothetical protein
MIVPATMSLFSVFFNCLSRKSPKVVHLALLWPYFLPLVKGLQVLLVIAGILGLSSAFMDVPFDLGTYRPFGLFGGFGLIFAGQVVGLLVMLLIQIGMTVIFDGERREVRFDIRSDRPESNLTQPIPYSEIRQLRLKQCIQGGKPVEMMLELVTTKDIYYPITVFRSAKKARAIVKEIQHLLGVPVSEETTDKLSITEYKMNFNRQFGSLPGEAQSDPPLPEE